MPVWLLLGALGLIAWAMNQEGQPTPQQAGGGSPPDPSTDPQTGQNEPQGNANSGSEGSNLPNSQSAQSPNQAFLDAYAITPWRDLISQTENENGIPELLLARILYQESKFRPDRVSKPNANGTVDRGIAQINSIHDGEISPDAALDPAQAIPWAGLFLANLYARQGTWMDAVRAYNGTGHAADLYAAAIVADVPSVNTGQG